MRLGVLRHVGAGLALLGCIAGCTSASVPVPGPTSAASPATSSSVTLAANTLTTVALPSSNGITGTLSLSATAPMTFTIAAASASQLPAPQSSHRAAQSLTCAPQAQGEWLATVSGSGIVAMSSETLAVPSSLSVTSSSGIEIYDMGPSPGSTTGATLLNPPGVIFPTSISGQSVTFTLSGIVFPVDTSHTYGFILASCPAEITAPFVGGDPLTLTSNVTLSPSTGGTLAFPQSSGSIATLQFNGFRPLGSPSDTVNGTFGNYDFAGIANVNASNAAALSGKVIYAEIEAHFGGTSGLNGYQWNASAPNTVTATLDLDSVAVACINTTPVCHVYYGLKAAISPSPLNLYYTGLPATIVYFYSPFNSSSAFSPNTDSDQDDVFMLVTN